MASSSPKSKPSDEELMDAYVDGDEAAFRALFERYAPILLRLTRRHLRNEELAEEIVQQTFFRLHGARNDFRRGSKLRPWVMTIAMNLVREHWRRTKRRKMTNLEVETQAAPEADFMPIELRQRSELLHVALCLRASAKSWSFIGFKSVHTRKSLELWALRRALCVFAHIVRTQL